MNSTMVDISINQYTTLSTPYSGSSKTSERLRAAGWAPGSPSMKRSARYFSWSRERWYRLGTSIASTSMW